MDEWRQKSATELGREIGAGRIDPVALTECFLEAIDGHEAGGDIYARVTPNRALAEAEAARSRAQAGARRGVLDGVPLSWKDLVDSGGTATESGSAFLKGRVPEHDAKILRIATLGGAVCLGKTHMTELAFSGLGLNPITATPPNVSDPAVAPGGSSSGAATSVAFGLAAAGIGSDTGGSVRVPSAWNNLVGLKTTSERVSLDGVVPLCAKFDTIGPLCRTVEDAAEVLALLEGRRAPSLVGVSVADLHLAVLETAALEDVRETPGAAFEAAVERLAAAGAKIDRIHVPAAAEALTLAGALYPAEAYATWKAEITGMPELMYPEVLKRFRQGLSVSAVTYVEAWQKLDRYRVAYLDAVAAYDAVLIPTSPILPPNVARLMSDPEYFLTENLAALRNTRIGNLLGLCALTMPTGVASCGVTLMAPPMSEDRLLRVGRAAEDVLIQ